MVCPKCGREMLAGFLQSDVKSGITWVREIRLFGLSYWKNDAEFVSEELKIGIAAIPTHICKHCKILMGDYSRKK